MTHKRLTKKMKEARRRINGAAVMEIYQRGTQSGVDEYLAINQQNGGAGMVKAMLAADARTARRNAKRLVNWTGEPLAPDAFCLTNPDGECISIDPRCMHQPKERAA